MCTDNTATTDAYSVTRWTVIRRLADGTTIDLNAESQPCGDQDDLIAFIEELHAQGAFDRVVADRLIESAKSLIRPARPVRPVRLGVGRVPPSFLSAFRSF